MRLRSTFAVLSAAVTVAVVAGCGEGTRTDAEFIFEAECWEQLGAGRLCFPDDSALDFDVSVNGRSCDVYLSPGGTDEGISTVYVDVQSENCSP